MRTTSLGWVTGCGRCGGRCTRHLICFTNFHILSLLGLIFYGWVCMARLLWPKRRPSEQKYFSRNSIVALLKRRENTLSLFGVHENFLVKFYYCQKVNIEKCYIVRTAGK